MAVLTISPAAERDLEAIALHIAEESGSVEIALGWLDGLEQKCAVLAETPLMGAAREDIAPGLRHWVVGQYLVFYRALEGSGESGVEIARVLHGARDIGRSFQ